MDAYDREEGLDLGLSARAGPVEVIRVSSSNSAFGAITTTRRRMGGAEVEPPNSRPPNFGTQQPNQKSALVKRSIFSSLHC